MINEYFTYFQGNTISVLNENKYLISVVVFLVVQKEQMLMIIVL
jgi:hypothetical protein